MSIFKKKEPPKREVVRFAGTESDIVWRRFIPDCDYECEVVCDPYHKVIYKKDGRAQEDISAERVIINTNEKKEKNQARFDVELIYVNTSNRYKITWGTAQQARVVDGFFQIPVSFGMSGDFKIKITNPNKFFAQFNAQGKLDTEAVKSEFSSQMTMAVMETLTNEITAGRISVYSLWSNASSVAQEMEGKLRSKFDNYGIEITDFAIARVVVSDSDIRQFEEILRKKRLLEMKETSFTEEAAKNQADKKAAMDTIVKLAEIDANRNKHNITINNNAANTARFCPYCGSKLMEGAAFCSGCGKKVN